MNCERSEKANDGAQTNNPPAVPAIAVTPPAGSADELPLSTPRGVEQMRRYVAEQRGQALIRVRPGLYMFGSGNW